MKTAMQELIKHIQNNATKFSLMNTYNMLQEIEPYLEKEKEQIIDAFDYGYYCASNGTSAEITLDGKMHYNQTYNQNK